MSDASSKPPEKQATGFSAQGAQVGWGPVAAVVFTALVYFGAQFLSGILLTLVAAATGLSAGLSGEGSSPIAGQFYFVLLSDVIILLMLWLFLRRRKAPVQDLGFGRRPVWRDIGYALVGYGVYFAMLIVALVFVGAATGVNLDQKQELGFDGLFSPGAKIMALVALVVLPPIVEEVVFRGFVFAGIRKKLTFGNATIITSLLFAAPHLLASSEGLLWVAGIDTLVLSFVLCYLREKTGALWAPMIVHAVKNVIAYSLLLSSAA